MDSKQTTATHKHKHLQLFYTEIAKLLTSSLEVSEVIKAIMNEIKNYFRPKNWSLLRLDPATNTLFFVIADGIQQEIVKHVHLNLGEGIAGHVAKTAKSRIVQHAESDPYFLPLIDKLTGFKTLSVIAVPIIFQNQMLGVIELINALEENPFSEEDLQILETIADFAAIALTNATRYEYMSSMATRDPLTGFYNRTRLNELIQNACNPPTQSNNTSAIVVFIDIDNLKKVNDQLGHPTGDKLLVDTSKLIDSCVDEGGFCFRFGGDEFIIIYPEVDKSSVEEKVNSLVKKLEKNSQPSPPGDGFSFGLVTGDKKQLNELITEADKKLYQAKLARKNKNNF